MLRRTFLQSAAAAAAPVMKSSAAAGGIRLGYDTYSIRSWRFKAMQHLEYSAKLKLDTIQMSSLGDFESLEPTHLESVRRKAQELDITIDAGIGCICPSAYTFNPKQGDPVDILAQGLRVAKAVGAKSLRCFMSGNGERRGKLPMEAHMENTVKVFKKAKPVALETGVKIALENHGDLQAWEHRTIIEEAGKDYVAACLDAGNPLQVIEDPLVTMEVLGPYTVTTHIRDTALYEHPKGAAWQWTAVGEGSMELGKFLDLHKKLCPNASMQLEIITGRPPAVLPYLEPDFWKAFPRAKASEFSKFVDLARRGRPFSGTMVISDVSGQKFPPEYQAALKEQQKVDLERSLEYCKKVLGVGLKK